MASGGHKPKTAATEPRQRSTWQRTTSMSDKEDNISINSIPNELRPNNWVTWTYIKVWMRLNFGQIPSLTTELAALEHLKKILLPGKKTKYGDDWDES